MASSRIPGFYKLSMEERLSLLNKSFVFNEEEQGSLNAHGSLSREKADKMIENAVGQYALPYGIGLNFLINGKDHMIPMVIEEPSVVASASHIAKIVRLTGGFTAKTTKRIMIGQIQVLNCPDVLSARRSLLKEEKRLIKSANNAYPSMLERGGGAEGIEVRILDRERGCSQENMLVVHLLVNTCDAMGANTINTMVEAISPMVQNLTGGQVHLRILSNFTDQCLAKAFCMIPPQFLATENFTGEAVRDGIIDAYEFARRDIYRAVTHNKGVMNGIDAVVMATGNDWRAIEAGAHAYASRFGRYDSMTEWSVDGNGFLVGALELPMPVGTVGGSIGIHPMAQISQKILGVKNASELAQVIVSVGLAQNLGALKALVTDGIQKGHMALQARSVAVMAGAKGEKVNMIARKLVEANEFRVDKAKELMEQ